MRQDRGRGWGQGWLVAASAAGLALLAGCADAAPQAATPDGQVAGAAASDRSVDAADAPTAVPATAALEERPARPRPEGPTITAVRGFERIVQKTDTKSPLIGLIRAGQSVPLAKPEKLEGPGLGHCKGGWYAVKPRGYVCLGANSTLDPDDPAALAAAEMLPHPDQPMPFRVGHAVGSPQYQRIPSAAEQRQKEPGLDKHLAAPLASDATGLVETKAAGHGPSKVFRTYSSAQRGALTAADDAYPGRKMAFVHEFDAEGRTWLVTPDLTLVPKDKVRFAAASKLMGIDLRARADMRFPIGYTWIGETAKLEKRADGTFAETGETWPRQTFLPIDGQLVMGKGGPYWKTKEGAYVRNDQITLFKKREGRPAGVGPKDKWIEVRITWGTLVAYEGDEPVYATAISPGQDGVTERAHGHTTKRGTYQVGWKLVTADMAGVEKGKEWAVDEVPFVAYYKDSYAVHGAWWHDEFGRPKSHGCVNVAPNDAHWLWRWMDPQMPEGWYAVAAYYPEVKGTTIAIKP